MNKQEIDSLEKLIYDRDLDGIKKEVIRQLVLNDEELEAPDQTTMPDDWHDQLVQAKIDHDKYGFVATHLFIPLQWYADFKRKIVDQSDTRLNKIYNAKYNIIYGAYIVFGPYDQILAASTEWLKNQ